MILRPSDDRKQECRQEECSYHKLLKTLCRQSKFSNRINYNGTTCLRHGYSLEDLETPVDVDTSYKIGQLVSNMENNDTTL